jgi:hypothetical protein
MLTNALQSALVGLSMERNASVDQIEKMLLIAKSLLLLLIVGLLMTAVVVSLTVGVTTPTVM